MSRLVKCGYCNHWECSCYRSSPVMDDSGPDAEIATLREKLERAEDDTRRLMEALKPFAECERLWMNEGKRSEIRMDWLTAANAAIAQSKEPVA